MLSLKGEVPEYRTILQQMKLSNDMVLMWMEHCGLVDPGEGYTRVLWEEKRGGGLDKEKLEESYEGRVTC
jgi:hypothetical protein